MEEIIIRPAKISDVAEMAEIINNYADQGLMLKKSKGTLIVNIGNFLVALKNNQFVGVCGSKIFPDGSLEIISAAVKEEAKGCGLGKKLVLSQINRAKELGFKKIFALTYVPEFFEKIGFKRIEKNLLSGKIWEECIYCPKNTSDTDEPPQCEEQALILEI